MKIYLYFYIIASLVNNADSRSLYKDKSKDEQADKSQSPPPQNGMYYQL